MSALRLVLRLEPLLVQSQSHALSSGKVLGELPERE